MCTDNILKRRLTLVLHKRRLKRPIAMSIRSSIMTTMRAISQPIQTRSTTIQPRDLRKHISPTTRKLHHRRKIHRARAKSLANSVQHLHRVTRHHQPIHRMLVVATTQGPSILRCSLGVQIALDRNPDNNRIRPLAIRIRGPASLYRGPR